MAKLMHATTEGSRSADGLRKVHQASLPDNDLGLVQFHALDIRQGLDQRLRLPFRHQLIDFL